MFGRWHLARQLALGRGRPPGSRLGFALGTASVALCVAIMQISYSVVTGFEAAIHRKLVQFVADVELRPGPLPGTGTQRQAVVLPNTAALKLPPGSRSVPFASTEAVLQQGRSHEGVRVLGWPLQAFAGSFLPGSLVQGHLPQGPLPNDPGGPDAFSRQVVVGKPLAQRLGLKPGQAVQLVVFQDGRARARAVKVGGIYETGLEEFDRNLVLADLRLLQHLLRCPNEAWAAAGRVLDSLRRRVFYGVPTLGAAKAEIARLQALQNSLPPTRRWRPDEVEGLAIHLPPGASEAGVARQLNESLGGTWQAYPSAERYPELFNWLQLQHQNVYFILGLLLLVCVVNLCTALLMLVLDRTPTVGLLRALGSPRWQVQQLFVAQAALMLGLGLLVGNALGLGLLASQHWGQWVQMDPKEYFVRTVPVAWPWGRFLAINLGTVVVCWLAVWWPARRAALLRPVRALRLRR